MKWGDILLHAVVGVIAVALGAFVGWWKDAPWAVWGAVAALAVGFAVREELQARKKYGMWLKPWEWSGQKMLEAIAPVVTGAVVALGVETIY